MKNVFIVVAIAALAAGGYVFYESRSRSELAIAVEEANAAPVSSDERIAFVLSDMDGQMRDSSEWDGKPRLINFWATWCAPCRREIPLLKQAQDEHTDIDLQVIGIAVDFIDEVVAYAEAAEFNYPILVGQEDATEVAEASGVQFIGLPFTLVVAPSGELIKAHVGEIFEEHIEQIATVFRRMEAGELDLAAARTELGTL